MSQYAAAHWAQITWGWKHSTAQEKAQAALVSINRRQARHNCWAEKPRVVVIKAQGKPLLVFVSGHKFVSAFTWDRLLYKAVHDPWKILRGTTLERRLP